MATNYEGVVTTKKGLRLLAKLATSAEKLVFTCVKVGTGLLQEGIDPSDLLDLVTYKMDGMIADYGYDDESEDSYVVMQVVNTGVKEGFIMTEIGLYAEDPDLGEILYAYVDLSNDPNHIMPSENGRSKTVQVKLHIIVGEAKEIQAIINPSAQITREVFEREVFMIKERILALRETRIIVLPSSGWSASAPYTQTVQVSGVTAEDTPIISLYHPAGTTYEEEKAAKKAYSCISWVDTGPGTITATCLGKKPAAKIQLILKGV